MTGVQTCALPISKTPNPLLELESGEIRNSRLYWFLEILILSTGNWIMVGSSIGLFKLFAVISDVSYGYW